MVITMASRAMRERLNSMDNMQDSLGKLTEEIQELRKEVKTMQTQIKPIVEAYDSVIFGKKFLIGLATVIGSLAAIGGGILWIVDYIRHGS